MCVLGMVKVNRIVALKTSITVVAVCNIFFDELSTDERLQDPEKASFFSSFFLTCTFRASLSWHTFLSR